MPLTLKCDFCSATSNRANGWTIAGPAEQDIVACPACAQEAERGKEAACTLHAFQREQAITRLIAQFLTPSRKQYEAELEAWDEANPEPAGVDWVALYAARGHK